jgi:3,4-dehydroadipyl-CoA semialdehyde dehydrogenase
MVVELKSYLCGEWKAGTGKAATLSNPATGEALAQASSAGLDLKAALAFAREVGGPALRQLTFAQRGEILTKLATLMHKNRDALIELGVKNAGNTRGDAKFDVDGAAAVLAYYGEFAKTLPAKGHWIPDGGKLNLGISERFSGQHVWVPIDGVAVHVNAYNFPAWGLMEKAACSWLAGVPVLSKPATSTALMAHRLAELVIDSGLLPRGAFSFLAGPAGDLMQHVDERDAVAFTGSSGTGAWMRSLEHVRAKSVRLNVEADSLNAAILGPDAEAGSETFELFVGDVFRDMTQKAGQKCTAIRRAFVPEALLDAVREALCARLAEVKIGDPAVDGVRMGPLASHDALKTAREGLAKLEAAAKVAYRGAGPFLIKPGDEGKGAFLAPVLLEAACDAPLGAINEIEVFGPVSTLIPYSEPCAMMTLVKQGGGGLVASVYSDDRKFLKDCVGAIAATHGRLFLGSTKIAGQSPGPGTALSQLQHGGPGRAGGGCELGGERGLFHNMQRVALEGYGPMLDFLTQG